MAWKQGAFLLEHDVTSPAQSINRSSTGLLLEAAQRMDEGAADGEPAGEALTSLFSPAQDRGIFDALAAEGPRSEAEGVPGQGGPRSGRRPGGGPPPRGGRAGGGGPPGGRGPREAPP